MKIKAWAAIVCPLLLNAQVSAGVYFSDYEAPASQTMPFSTEQGPNGNGRIEAYELITALAPKGWKVNLGPGLANAKLSWKASPNWQAAIRNIQKLNKGIYITINHENGVIAVAAKREHLEYLETQDPMVWVIDPALSLSKNFMKWNEKSNIPIIYNADQDYEIKSRSVLVGDLYGVDGVIDRVLQSTKNRQWPLSVTYHPQVPALVISFGGATPKNQ